MSSRVAGERAWGRTIISSAAFLLAAVTMFWRDWIELIFRIDPDSHSGLLEWGIVGMLLLTAAIAGISAGRSRRRSSKRKAVLAS